MTGAFYKIDSEEGWWNTGRDEQPNLGYKVRTKGGYFPVPPYDHHADLREDMTANLISMGFDIERGHHEVGGGQAEINYKFNTLLASADEVMLFKYIIKNTAWAAGQDRHLHAQAACSVTTAPACTRTSRCGPAASRCSTTSPATAGCRDMARYYIGGLLHHAPSLLAFTNPTVNSYHRLVPGYEAPVNLVYSARNRSACIRIPLTGTNAKAKRLEFRCPDPSSNPYLAFAAMMMAGLDGIKNKIEPPAPVDKDLYELPPDEAANIPQVPGSLASRHRPAGAGPRLPARGRRLHPRPDRDVDQAQAGRDRRDPPAPAPLRVRHVLRHLSRASRFRHRAPDPSRSGARLRPAQPPPIQPRKGMPVSPCTTATPIAAEEVTAHRPAHRAFLRDLFDQGVVLAAGAYPRARPAPC